MRVDTGLDPLPSPSLSLFLPHTSLLFAKPVLPKNARHVSCVALASELASRADCSPPFPPGPTRRAAPRRTSLATRTRPRVRRSSWSSLKASRNLPAIASTTRGCISRTGRSSRKKRRRSSSGSLCVFARRLGGYAKTNILCTLQAHDGQVNRSKAGVFRVLVGGGFFA